MNSYDLLIEKLDAFTRKFYLNQILRGSLYAIALIGLLFLTFNLLEHYFFFGTGGRKLLFYSFLMVSLGSLGYWVIRPLLHYFHLGQVISHEQAAKIIGKHFADVEDKLLNILQLNKQSSLHADNDLILASINQKSEQIKLVPFPKAIDLRKNRRYLRYAMPPLLVILALLFAAPSIITDSTKRIIRNSEEFTPDAPFHFKLENDVLSVGQFEDLELAIRVDGEYIPDEAFINIGESQYRLKKESSSTFSYILNNVKNDLEFSLTSGPVESEKHKVSVRLKPQLASFEIHVDHPAYTGFKDEVISNTGDIVVPQGTKVSWFLTSLHADDAFIALDANEDKPLQRKSESDYTYTYRAMKSMPYTLRLSNNDFTDSIAYNINVIPDHYPTIEVEKFVDSLDRDLKYFVGSVSDDYGLSGLSFNYRIKPKDGGYGSLNTQALKKPTSRTEEYDFLWDVKELKLKPGDEVEYYFEVFDNDRVNGAKSSKTQILKIEMPTEKELEEKSKKNSEDIKKELEKAIKKTQQNKKELKELREKLLQQKELNWQDRKKLEDLLKEQQKMQEQMKEAQKMMEENKEADKQLNKEKEELLEKQEKLDEMFEKVLDEETQKLMEEIQKLLQELEKDDALQKWRKWK